VNPKQTLEERADEIDEIKKTIIEWITMQKSIHEIQNENLDKHS
jgi:hypothetical protein